MTRVPRAASAFLRLITTRALWEEREGDLEEAFSSWVERRGPSYARVRCWREVALVVLWAVVGIVFRSYPRRRASPPPGDLGPRRGHDLLFDVRHGLRRLVTNPIASAVAVLLLAVGIGGNTTAYTLVKAAFLEDPPLLQAPEELVGLDWAFANGSGPEFGYYDYEFYRDYGEAFADVLAYGGVPGARGRRTDNGGGEVVVGGGADVDQAGAWVVSGNYFDVLGVPMALGPGFSPEIREEEGPGAEVVLSQGYWVRKFGADPAVLGRSLLLNGVAFQVVGVTPPTFRGVNPREPMPDLFLPILSADLISRGFSDQLRRFQADGSPSASRFLRLVARLRPGVDMETAQAETDVLQRRWEAEFSLWAQEVYGETYRLTLRKGYAMASYESQALRRQLFLFWFMVGGVFLIGCANLAILLLASASDREREMGIRASLGAGRRRLFTQLVTESMILSLIGGGLGVGVAYLGSGFLMSLLSLDLGNGTTPDVGVVAFALLLSTFAAVLFGSAPSWKLSRVDVAALIQRPGQARAGVMVRGGLVVTQTALTTLLLIGGGLMARSIREVRTIDLGFEPDQRVVLGVQLDNRGYSEAEGRAFVLQALDRLSKVPGVVSASVCNRVPFLGSNTWTFTAPGTDFEDVGLRSGLNLVGPDYFQTMGIPVIAGRALTREDGEGGERAIMVNRTFAEALWPGEDPLGKSVDGFDGAYTVVGVAEDAVYYNVTEKPRPHVYFSSLQLYQGMQNFVVATGPPIATMTRPLEEALRTLDGTLAVTPQRLSLLVEQQVSDLRIWTALIEGFALVALFLALVGLYGVQSYMVSRKRREIGIRLALGAEAGGVVGGFVGRGLLLGAMGALGGLGAAVALSGLMRGFLYGVAPLDPLILTTVPLLLLSTCAAASFVPARRAGATQPAEALRRE